MVQLAIPFFGRTLGIFCSTAIMVVTFCSLRLDAAPKQKPNASVCQTVELKETLVSNDGPITLNPVNYKGQLIVANSAGTIKIFKKNGEVEKQASINDAILLPPFVVDDKLVVVSVKKIYLLKASTLETTKKVDIRDIAEAGGKLNEKSFALGFRSGKVIVYDSNSEEKLTVDGVRPNSQFEPFFSTSRGNILVGQNSLKFLEKSSTDIVFPKMIKSAAAKGLTMAVGDEGGTLYLVDLIKRKFKAIELSAPVDSILPAQNREGFVVNTANGKLLLVKDEKNINELPVKTAPKGLIVSENLEYFVFSEGGDTYKLVGDTVSKTSLKGSYDRIFDWGKGKLTYSGGVLRVLGAEGDVLQEKRVDGGAVGIRQIHGNIFVALGMPIRVITVALEKCKK